MAARKPILVIDLTPAQLELDTDTLEQLGHLAAGQINSRIEEVHWRIGNRIMAVTHCKNEKPLSQRQKKLLEVPNPEHKKWSRKVARPGEWDAQGRFRPFKEWE